MNKNFDDKEVVDLILKGDQKKFELLENKYKKLIFSLIRKMVRNEEDVEDLTQDSFIKAFNALSSYNEDYSFSSWLYRIASNTCIDFLRKKRFATVSINQPVADDDEYVMEIEDNSFIPDMGVLNEERRLVITSAIDNLPDNYKKVVKMRHEEELDYKEISEKLDLPLGTVKAHLFRARKILLTELKNRKDLFGEYMED